MEPVADLGRLREGGVGSHGIAAEHGLERRRHEHVPPLHAVQVVFVEYLAGPGQPSAAPGHLATEQQPQGGPESTSCGSCRVTPPQPLLMCTCPDVDGDAILAQETRGAREPLQIGRLER